MNIANCKIRSQIRKILCFGDSLTEGYLKGGTAFHPYTLKLHTLLSNDERNTYEVINEGLSGETVFNEMRKRLPSVLKKYNGIDMVILQGGTNDILQHANNKSLDFIDEFRKLLNIVRGHDVNKVCLMTIIEGYFSAEDDAVLNHYDSDILRRTYNEQIIECANHKNIILCDIARHLPMFSLNELERKALWDDMLHPSIAGYDKMAEILFDHVRNEF